MTGKVTQNKKFFLIFLALLIIAIPLILLLIKQIKKTLEIYQVVPAEYEAVFLLNPNNQTNPSGISLSVGQRQKVEVLLNTQVGNSPAEVNAVEFKITYDPSNSKIVDEQGNPLNQVIIGNIFEGQNPFIAANTISNGVIYLSMLSTTGGFNGTNGLVASFYLEPLSETSSDTLSFVEVIQGNTIEYMHAYRRGTTDDILSASKMNGTPTSQLSINMAPPTPTPTPVGNPTFSLTTDKPNPVVDETFAVNIVINTDGNNTVGADAVIKYNPSFLEAVDLDQGIIYDSYPDLIIDPTNLDPSGNVVVEISGFSLPDSPNFPYNGTDTFATLSFKALEEGTTQIVFDYIPGETNESNILIDTYTPGQPKLTSDDILRNVVNLSLNIGPTAGTSCTARIKFQGINQQIANYTPNVEVIIGQTFQVMASPDASGVFEGTTPNTLTPGAYDIYVKGPAHLRRLFPQITLNQGANTQDFTGQPLKAGDINGDNRVAVGDYSLLNSKYGTTTSDPYEKEDLNKDGRIAVGDYSILNSNYGEQGD